jgi:hypothetical protein
LPSGENWPPVFCRSRRYLPCDGGFGGQIVEGAGIQILLVGGGFRRDLFEPRIVTDRQSSCGSGFPRRRFEPA